MGNGTLWEIIVNSSPIVKLILFLLLCTSIYSWAIIFFKYLSFKNAVKQTDRFLEVFWENRRFENIYEESKKLLKSPLSQIFIALYEELLKHKGNNNPIQKDAENSWSLIDTLERTITSVKVEEETRLESHLNFLASTASTTPFVGLFGTVWGIMESFHNIGQTSSASLSVVAPGISEALVATAMGLFTAIPAVVAYNYFVTRVRILVTQIDSFSSEFLNIVQRHLL